MPDKVAAGLSGATARRGSYTLDCPVGRRFIFAGIKLIFAMEALSTSVILNLRRG